MDLCQHASLRAVKRCLSDLRSRVTVYNPPTDLFDWRRTAFPAGMKLDTKRLTVDEPLKFFQRHKITQYNTTTLLRSGTEWAKKYDRSSLRVLGTVEESINSETYDVVREKRCSIVDILGQTVTDDCTMTPLFGVRPVVLNPADGTVVEGNDVAGGFVFSSSRCTAITSASGTRT